jgi:hypothetical protein
LYNENPIPTGGTLYMNIPTDLFLEISVKNSLYLNVDCYVNTINAFTNAMVLLEVNSTMQATVHPLFLLRFNLTLLTASSSFVVNAGSNITIVLNGIIAPSS